MSTSRSIISPKPKVIDTDAKSNVSHMSLYLRFFFPGTIILFNKRKDKKINKQCFNGKTFGNGHEHQDQRTSWVHNDEDRQQEEYGRIEQGFP